MNRRRLRQFMHVLRRMALSTCMKRDAMSLRLYRRPRRWIEVDLDLFTRFVEPVNFIAALAYLESLDLVALRLDTLLEVGFFHPFFFRRVASLASHCRTGNGDDDR